MNLEAILKWAHDMLSFVRDPTRNDGSQVEPWKVTIEFKWILEFAESIDTWQRLLDIVEQVVHYVRWEGYHQSAANQLEQRLAHLELLSIVVDQFSSRRRFWALQVPVPLLCSVFAVVVYHRLIHGTSRPSA